MLPPCEPVAIRDELQRILDALLEHDPPASAPPDQEPVPVALSGLAGALSEALNSLARCVHGDAAADAPALERVGDHAVDLLERTALHAEKAGATSAAQELRGLLLALACCVARNGGELSHLKPVADAVAEQAELGPDPARSRALYQMTDDITQGLSSKFSGAPPGSERWAHWRELLLSRAVIATRTLEPRLMAPAFDALVDELPGDAVAFFSEGLRRLDLLDYPDAVRELMQRYRDAHAARGRLH